MTSSSSPSPQARMHENYETDDGALFFDMVLLSVILFFVLLSLYIRYICSVLQDPIDIHEAPQPPLTLGLNPAEIRSLPVVICRREAAVAEEEEEEKECCICLGGFEEGDKMKVLPPCLHCYHCQCVDRWLKNESSCPLCRVSIRIDSSSLRV